MTSDSSPQSLRGRGELGGAGIGKSPTQPHPTTIMSLPRLLLLVLLPIGPVTLGCNNSDNHYWITPDGWKITEINDEGSFSSGLISYELVLVWLDQRVRDWLDYRSSLGGGGWSYAVLHNLVGQYEFRLFDNWAFWGHSVSGAVFGTSVLLSIYDHGWGVTVPNWAPQWTVVFNEATGNYNWGEIPSGVGLSVTSHELDHLIGVTHD